MSDPASQSPLSTSVNEALKEHYKPERVRNMVYQNNPLMALMPKYERFGGENMPIPIIVTGPQRRSATFATGQANTSTSTLRQFLLTRSKDYSFALIEHEAIKASQANTDAFLRYATMEIDGAIHSLKRSMAIAMFRDGNGARGQVSVEPSEQSNMVITLKKDEDITNFEVGMVVNVHSALTGGAQRNRNGSATDFTVDAVDRDAGTLTFTGEAYDSNGTIAADDFLFIKGDRGALATGLDGWIPGTAPTSGDSFFGVDRSADPTRLAGNRFDGSALPIEEALIGAASRVAREGGAPTHCFVDFKTYSNLEKALGSKVVYDKVAATDADVGFTALTINGPRGAIQVVPDQNCIPDVGFLLQMDTWALNSLGAAPQILDADGAGQLLRTGHLDAYECRVGAYYNISCVAPGYNCRIAFA